MTRVPFATVLLMLAAAAPAAARPADVRIVNSAADPVHVTASTPLPVTGPGGQSVPSTITNTPTVRPEPEHFQVADAVSTSSASGTCASISSTVPSGRSVVITDVAVSASDSIMPTAELRAINNTGSGFFTATYEIPLTDAPNTTRYTGFQSLNMRVIPLQAEDDTLQTLQICVRPAPGDTSTSMSFVVSGYLM